MKSGDCEFRFSGEFPADSFGGVGGVVLASAGFVPAVAGADRAGGSICAGGAEYPQAAECAGSDCVAGPVRLDGGSD